MLNLDYFFPMNAIVLLVFKKGNDMNRTVILSVGANDFLRSNDQWDVAAALNAETAIEKFHQMDFDVVVFTNLAAEDAVKLRKLFLFQQPGIILLQNNNNDLINAEIKTAAEKREQLNKHTFSIVDDALKGSALPITIQ